MGHSKSKYNIFMLQTHLHQLLFTIKVAGYDVIRWIVNLFSFIGKNSSNDITSKNVDEDEGFSIKINCISSSNEAEIVFLKLFC